MAICLTRRKPLNWTRLVHLPFDASAVLDNLRYERYVTSGRDGLDAEWAKEAYYTMRPFLPVTLRKHLSDCIFAAGKVRTFLHGRRSQCRRCRDKLMTFSLRALNQERIPFIWFWPEGHAHAPL
jgi:hypothetical protein